MARRIKIETEIIWRVSKDRETGAFVATCPALGISTFSDRAEELRDEVADAMNCLLNDLVQSGELDAFFLEKGWSISTPIPHRPDANLRFDIPFKMVSPENDYSGSTS